MATAAAVVQAARALAAAAEDEIREQAGAIDALTEHATAGRGITCRQARLVREYVDDLARAAEAAACGHEHRLVAL